MQLPPSRAAGAARSAAALILAFTLAGIGSVPAQERVVPQTRAEIQLSFAPAVKKVAPAVVNVYASQMVRRRPFSPFMDDPFFRRFFGDQGAAPPRRVLSSLGSGVIVSPDGVILTNNHVIKDADAVKVALADRREFDCEIIAKDERTDLAVLRIKGRHEALPFVEFGNSDALEVGDIVLAIGNPFGVGQTVTQGIVSALARTNVGISDYQFFIQTDAAINPGNSGGALIDTAGRLVGIPTAIYSRSGGSMGIGFAIPANMARLVAGSAMSGRPVERPWFGADLQAVTPDIASSLGLGRPRGVLVTQVSQAGPAARAGVRVGDLILSIDGKPVDDPQSFRYRFTTHGVGGTVNLEVLRNGRQLSLTVPLMTAPETVPRDERTISDHSPLAGATVVNLSPAVAEELGLENDEETGVVVSAVSGGSPADRLGLKQGDIIRNVNGVDIDSTARLEAQTRRNTYVWQLAIERDGQTMRLVIGG